MSDGDYIAHALLGSYADRKDLERAVETGARGVIKAVVRRLIGKRFPGFLWAVDIVVNIVCDYFGW